jgi:predicted nucleic acid-binding protein
VRFWDTSALVTLVTGPGSHERFEQLYGDGTGVCVWWVTPVEIVSTIARRERGGELAPDAATEANALLGRMEESWHEVPPSPGLRNLAKRLLRVHALRAADGLQLAAALTLAGDNPGGTEFVCRDSRLADAAAREGLRIRGA